MIRNVCRELKDLVYRLKAKAVNKTLRPKRSQPLRIALTFVSALMLPACGAPLEGNDGELDATEEGAEECRNPRLVDDFEDGNYAAESVGGNWVAGPGSRIAGGEGALRVEGRGNIEIELQVPASSYPLNYVGDHDALTVDVKVGRLSNPEEPFPGVIRINMEGISSVGRSFSETPITVEAFNQSVAQIIYYRIYSDPSFSLAQLLTLRITLEVEDSADYFMEIDNVRLCRSPLYP